MKETKEKSSGKRGRPKTGVNHLIGLRWHEKHLSEIDDWRRRQDDLPTRGEAIRRLVEIGLKSAKTKR